VPTPTYNMQPGQMTVLNVFGLIAGAQPGALVGAPTWTSSAPTIAAVKPSRDGLNCTVLSLGPVGSATITVTALGSSTLSSSVLVVVAAEALATSIGVSAGGEPITYPGEYP